MAQSTNKTDASNNAPKRPTAAQMREFYDKWSSKVPDLERFEQAQTAYKQMRRIDRTNARTISTFDKQTLASYLQNISSNESNLRNLSWYLYYRSQIYKRLINYNGTMFDLNARSVIPVYDITANNINDDQILKSWYETVSALDIMHLQSEFLKIYITCFIQDVYYGCAYYDETGLFILTLDPDYCRIAGRYPTGDLAFAMDLSYFRGNNEYLLEYWGEPFQSMYKTYQSQGNAARWQAMPDEYAVCMKQNIEDWKVIVPPFSGLFMELINLEDVKDIQAIADAQDIYKLVWLEMETLDGSKNVDDWKVDPELMIQYFNRMMQDAFPDYTSGAIVPGKLNVVNFDNDKTTDTNKVANATKTVLNSGGGAQILNSAAITGTTGLKLASKVDTELAISSLLGQTQGWTNRFLTYYVSNPARVKFFEISAYTKDDFRDQLINNATNGLPTKLAIMSLSGYSELETLSLNHLEEDILKLHDKLQFPLSSTFTSGGVPTEGTDPVEGGRPESDDKTDDGEKSEDKTDKSNR